MNKPTYHNKSLDSDLGQFLSDSKKVLEELKNDSYRISGSSRFSLSINEFSRFIKCSSQAELRKFDLTLLAEGSRDFTELHTIVKSKKIRKENRKEIQKIFSGTIKPPDDNLTQARDFQFEL